MDAVIKAFNADKVLHRFVNTPENWKHRELLGAHHLPSDETAY
jgi:hypothetical protein